MRIGILDILTDQTAIRRSQINHMHYFRRQHFSLMPQVISVWCRRAGHEVTYRTYFGQKDPKYLLPDDIDVLFVSSFTQASALAYALAKLFKRKGARTILGGPHAKAFPNDALRFFDTVVQSCDEAKIAEILRLDFPSDTIVNTDKPLNALPSIKERFPEIKIATFSKGRPLITSVVPLISSTGCPYSCDFCIDWNSKYTNLPKDDLLHDLQFLADNWPNIHIVFHDPNFAVQFDNTMDILDSVSSFKRNPYVMESSLAILKPKRLHRLRDTRCAYVAPGVESWADYSRKSGVGIQTGEAKLGEIVDKFMEIGQFVKGIQANFIFGCDQDSGYAPVQLTKDFIRKLPNVFPVINIPTPFGGTPLFNQLKESERILIKNPFAFYSNPYLTVIPKNYSPSEYYRHLIDINEHIISKKMSFLRYSDNIPLSYKFIHTLRHKERKQLLKIYRKIERLLSSDDEFFKYHCGAGNRLPPFYRQQLNNRLGSYAELLSEEDLTPVLA